MTEATVKKRYGAKLLTNLTGAVLGFITMSFVPRAVGAADFGRFEFITVNMTLIITTLSLSFPVAFFNWVAREDGLRRDVAVALSFVLSVAVGFTLCAIILLCSLFGGVSYLWPDLTAEWVWLGFLFSLLTFFVQNISYLADGEARSVGLETRRMIHNVARALGLGAAFFAGFLQLRSYFLIQIGLLLGLTIWLWVWVQPNLARIIRGRNRIEVRVAASAFLRFSWQYSHPLIAYSMVSLAYGYADRWVLQVAGGAAEQGYYGLANRFGTMTFVFTSAMTPVLTREFAVAFNKSDFDRLRALFKRIRMFVLMASVLGAFLAVNAEAIVTLIAGSGFKQAAIPVAIMAFYPVHQTFGQLSNALMIAAGQTRVYSRLGITFMLISIPVSYFLLAPVTTGQSGYILSGLGLGAMGLAVKMVAIQFVATNVFLFFNTRTLGTRLLPWVWFQAQAVAVPAALAVIADFIAGSLLSHSIAALMVNGTIFFLFTGLVVVFFPSLAGISRKEMNELWRQVRRKAGF